MNKENIIKYFKILIVILDIIVIVYIVFAYNRWKNINYKSLENKEEPLEVIKNNNQSFKNFTFELPDGVQYTSIDENKFKLTGDDYNATVEILLTTARDLFTYPELYYDYLISQGKKVNKPEKIQKGMIEMFKYSIDENTNIYYFDYNELFYYEVELNDDGDNIGSIMNILLTAKYDNTGNTKYTYTQYDLKDEDNIKQTYEV